MIVQSKDPGFGARFIAVLLDRFFGLGSIVKNCDRGKRPAGLLQPDVRSRWDRAFLASSRAAEI